MDRALDTEKDLERMEMNMLRWMIEIKRIEKIRTEEIRAKAGVANISDSEMEY